MRKERRNRIRLIARFIEWLFVPTPIAAGQLHDFFILLIKDLA
jgi:hypothetical protein